MFGESLETYKEGRRKLINPPFVSFSHFTFNESSGSGGYFGYSFLKKFVVFITTVAADLVAP